MKNSFDILKSKFKTHKAAAAYLGVSYSQYNDWRWQPDRMPARAKMMMEMAAKLVNAETQSSKCRCPDFSARER